MHSESVFCSKVVPFSLNYRPNSSIKVKKPVPFCMIYLDRIKSANAVHIWCTTLPWRALLTRSMTSTNIYKTLRLLFGTYS